FSRHIYKREDRELKEGTLCYVKLQNGTTHHIDGIYPVMIPVKLNEKSPWDVLDDSLKPASKISELSPADRVFGWVPENKPSEGQTASKHLLKIKNVKFVKSQYKPIEDFGDAGLPLAVLGSPKPQQARFYVAQNKNGDAQNNGISRTKASYSHNDNSLRGRKVYPHHKNLPNDYWKKPLSYNFNNQHGRWKEYIRPGFERDKLNMSIKGWVNPECEFQFDISFMNLSKVELGALIWLLKLGNGKFHRFGGGKPLGFGSVKLDIESADIKTKNDIKQEYSFFLKPEARETIPDAEEQNPDLEHFINEFKIKSVEFYKTSSNMDNVSFDEIPYIKAFLKSCEGFNDDLPVHYPRITRAPNPDGKTYEWFVKNERGNKLSLPNIKDDNGFPIS
ncbi:MAG: TIGR03986 family CRISPR-associated RAMP protein, partial [bacterium]